MLNLIKYLNPFIISLPFLFNNKKVLSLKIPKKCTKIYFISHNQDSGKNMAKVLAMWHEQLLKSFMARKYICYKFCLLMFFIIYVETIVCIFTTIVTY